MEDCWGRSLWAFGTAARRAPERLDAPERAGLLRARRRAALALAPGDGLRRAGRGRGARRSTPATTAARAAARRRRHHDRPPRRRRRLALAGAAALLRQRRRCPRRSWPPAICSSRPDVVERRPHPAAVAARPRDRRRAPVADAGRRCRPGDRAPAFDQQPIEVAAMADACARAAAVTGDPAWLRRRRAGRPGGSPATTTPAPSMWDPATGGGYDGLQASGPNLNQGAESTLALISTLQHARAWLLAPASGMTIGRAGHPPTRSACLADPSRVIAQLFVPGHALPAGRRGTGLGRRRARPRPRRRRGGRHAGARSWPASAAATATCTATFRRNADRIANRLDPGIELSAERWLLLGATFTHEYSVEAAALCNPSVVPAPDQSGVPDRRAALRHERPPDRRGPPFVDRLPHRPGRRRAATSRSTRPGRYTTAGTIDAGMLDGDAFRQPVADRRRHRGDHLGARRPGRALHRRRARRPLGELEAQRDTRRNVAADRPAPPGARRPHLHRPLRPSTQLAERVLLPGDRASSPTASRTPASCASSTTTARVTYYATLHGLRRHRHRPAAAGDRPTS